MTALQYFFSKVALESVATPVSSLLQVSTLHITQSNPTSAYVVDGSVDSFHFANASVPDLFD